MGSEYEPPARTHPNGGGVSRVARTRGGVHHFVSVSGIRSQERLRTFPMVHVLVMAKEPIPGRGKPRLSPPCTPQEAAALAAAALADVLAAATTCGADRVVLALDGRPGAWCP